MLSETCSGTYTDYSSTFFILVSKEKYLRNLVSRLCSYKYFCLETPSLYLCILSFQCRLWTQFNQIFLKASTIAKLFFCVLAIVEFQSTVLDFRAPTQSQNPACSRCCFQLLLFISVLKLKIFRYIYPYMPIYIYKSSFLQTSQKTAIFSTEEYSKNVHLVESLQN